MTGITVRVVDVGINDGSVNPGCSNNPLHEVSTHNKMHSSKLTAAVVLGLTHGASHCVSHRGVNVVFTT